MTKPVLLSALVAACAVLASGAFAEGMDNKSKMDKPAMGSSDKMANPAGAKPDGMAKPASDKMEKPGTMMDKKDTMSSDKMKK